MGGGVQGAKGETERRGRPELMDGNVLCDCSSVPLRDSAEDAAREDSLVVIFSQIIFLLLVQNIE